MNYHYKENMEDVNLLKMCHRTLKQMFLNRMLEIFIIKKGVTPTGFNPATFL
jgi:hypothetical protein